MKERRFLSLYMYNSIPEIVYIYIIIDSKGIHIYIQHLYDDEKQVNFYI